LNPLKKQKLVLKKGGHKMFKTLYNQARIGLCIEPVTPILIKTGRETFDPTRPDHEFVRTVTEFGEAPYLPGSSLKGVIRSHAERILRTLNLEKSECDITQKACVPSGGQNVVRYEQHCFACRTFGSMKLASRIRFTDAYPWTLNADKEEMEKSIKSVLLESRTNVRIDRRTGAAARGALFNAEVVTSGKFHSEIVIRNYQLWQIALLALVFRDINAGHQRVGASKSRGLGKVKVTITDFDMSQFGILASDNSKLTGVGQVDGYLASYGLVKDDSIVKPNLLSSSVPLGSVSLQFKPDGPADESWKELAIALVASNNWKALLERRNNPQ
jgi:CRISPR-associated RAMP protein (TIGR02581 family)